MLVVGASLGVVVLALILLCLQVRALVAVVDSLLRTLALQPAALEAQFGALRKEHEIDINLAVRVLSRKIDALEGPAAPGDADAERPTDADADAERPAVVPREADAEGTATDADAEEEATCVLKRSTMLSIAPPRKKP